MAALTPLLIGVTAVLGLVALGLGLFILGTPLPAAAHRLGGAVPGREGRAGPQGTPVRNHERRAAKHGATRPRPRAIARAARDAPARRAGW